MRSAIFADQICGTLPVHRVTPRIHGDRHRHVLHFEFMDGFHAEFRKGDDGGSGDRLGDQIGRPANGNHIGRAAVTDRVYGRRATLGLTDHADQTGLLEQRAGEFVHAGGSGRTGRTDHFITHRSRPVPRSRSPDC